MLMADVRGHLLAQQGLNSACELAQKRMEKLSDYLLLDLSSVLEMNQKWLG